MRSSSINQDDFIYFLPENEWLFKKIEEFEEFLPECQRILGIEELEIEVNHILLINVFVRIDERKDYFMYFHSVKDYSMRMSLGKEIALEAYWISKYQPIRLKNINDEIEFTISYRVTISDVIAALLIIAFLVDYDKELDVFFDAKRINTLIYDIFNRDISKEAMIMYVESFLKDDEEGEDDEDDTE